MFEKLQHIEKKYNELRAMQMDPSLISDLAQSRSIAKQLSDIEELYQLFLEYKKFLAQRDEAKMILDTETDSEMVEMAKEQLHDSVAQLESYDQKIKVALLPKDPNDDKNIFLEIRPAAGGDEAGLFAQELLRAYMLYAQQQGWKTEVVEQQLSDIGGVKLVVLKMSGNKVYSKMKWESGVHRVQRIPKTETQGRVHTSTVTVAIMPEVDEVQMKELNMEDIEMDTYAASSSGGQNANKNQTGVRLRHQPTGIIVNIGDSKSQLQNKEKAFAILRAKLYQIEQDKQEAENRETRGDQIGSGDRSEKIRTYNFPQDRVTDHRIKESWSNLPSIMEGNIDDLIHGANSANQAMMLAKQLDKQAA